MEILVQRAEFVPGTSVPLFELRPPVFDGVDYFIKRTFDVDRRRCCCCCSSRRCWRVIALLVRFTSRGPVIYRSSRPGHRRRAVRRA